MSTAQSFPPGRGSGETSTLTLDFNSKNPFRNRTTSPANDFFGSALSSPGPPSPFDDPSPAARPLSTNPFLDPLLTKQSEPLISLGAMSTQSDKRASPTAEELFDSITLEDEKPRRPNVDENRRMRQPPPPAPRRRDAPPAPNHRPTQSQEEALRTRKPQGGESRRPPGGSSESRPERRPRRNSDSSLLIDIEKPLTEEEKKAHDARRRERERRHRPSRPNRRVDLIDQLDMTGIHGVGSFHHDGPFDACNPHRNRKGSRRAPMSAFAKDSPNNSIGGAGPLNDRPDHKRFMGTADEEAFTDYSRSGRYAKESKKSSSAEGTYFDPTSRGEILHGDDSLGLGTSTFLEGTPAARAIIQKREAQQAQEFLEGGLQRKKSLAQRIRGVGRAPGTRPSFGEGGRRPTLPDLPPIPDKGRYSDEAVSPNDEFGKEPESITVRKADPGRGKSPTSPPSRPRGLSGGLERRVTADGTEEAGKQGAGFLSRVKSLKGSSRRPRVQGDAPSPPAAPGTAV